MPDDLTPKLLELLVTMAPATTRVAVLVDARTPQEIEQGFSTIAREGAQAVIVSTSGAFIQQQREIAELALKYRVPAIFAPRGFAQAGGLMSYGPSFPDNYRRAASYADKIFKGAKPGDLPLEQPTKFELIINRKTAKALGLTIPQSLLLSANALIE
jgi:putative tryptophan/tyrosine transport system substrate-binding protein